MLLGNFLNESNTVITDCLNTYLTHFQYCVCTSFERWKNRYSLQNNMGYSEALSEREISLLSLNSNYCRVLQNINKLLKRPGMEFIPKRVENSDAAIW